MFRPRPTASSASPARVAGSRPSRAFLRMPFAVAAASAVVAVLGAGLATGAFRAAPTQILDPGDAVRYGLPLSRAVRDLAAAATVGLLLLAGTIVPEARSTQRRLTATRLATACAGLWLASASVVLVLAFSDVAGVPVGHPTFVTQLQRYLLDIQALRMGVISAVMAAFVLVGASVVRRRGPTAALAGLSVLALLPLALGGHTAGTDAHATAVDTLALHLVATAVWVGGLIALVALSPVLGSTLAVCARRYSTLAGWCFVGVAASGVLGAWVRLGGVGGLGTAYGLLVLAKTAALVALGIAGWWQRRRVLPLLEGVAEGGRRAFWRLALGEMTLMALAFGVAAVLARTSPPVPAEPPAASTPAQSLTGFLAPEQPLAGALWVTSWRVDWLWLALAATAVGLYAAAALRLARRGDGWPLGRSVAWLAGWVAFVYATSGPPGVYGRVLFSAHMVMHLVLAMVVPVLLVLAAPVTLGLRALVPRRDRTLGPRELLLALVHSRLLNTLGNPVVAAVLFFGGLVAFYFTGLFELALRTHTGHVLMVLHFLATGYLFAWVLVGLDPGPRRWAPPLRLVVLFAVVSFHAFFGVALTSQTTLLAPGFYTALQLPWPVDLLADQQHGGAVAWGIGEIPALVLAMLVTLAWVRSDAAETRRRDRNADRDGEAELAAYNRALAARAARGDGRGI